jgi:hypothetical protein
MKQSRPLPHQGPLAFGRLLGASLRLLSRTWVRLLAVAVSFAVAGSLLATVVLTNGYWTQAQLQPQYDELIRRITNPDYVLTPDDDFLRGHYFLTFYANFILYSFFQFLIPVGLMFIATHYLVQKIKKPSKASLIGSIARPFIEGRAVTSLFLLLALSIMIPFLILLLVIPGFLLLVWSSFLYHVVSVEGIGGGAVLRGATRYVKGHFWRLLVYAFIGWGFPAVLSPHVINLFWEWTSLTTEQFAAWLDPAARNYLGIFGHHLIKFMVLALFYLYLPCLYAYGYVDITARFKQGETVSSETIDAPQGDAQGGNVLVVTLQGSQKRFVCPACKTRLQVGMARCYACGQLFKFKRR